MIEILLTIYFCLVIVFGAISMIFINEKLRKMGNIKIALFLFLQPILIFREVIKK
jgi:hypothetical protein